jgi:hypothetical protein
MSNERTLKASRGPSAARREALGRAHRDSRDEQRARGVAARGRTRRPDAQRLDSRRLQWASALTIVAALAGCTTNTTPPPPPVDDMPCDLQPGTVCEAVYLRALSSCARVERCQPDAFTDLCVAELVADDCAVNDCAAPYTRLDELEACLWDFDRYACVVIQPPTYCAL